MIRKRLCRLLFKLKLYRAAEAVSPSIFCALLGERVSEGFAAGFQNIRRKKSND